MIPRLMIRPSGPSTAMEPRLTQTRRAAAKSCIALRKGCAASGAEGAATAAPSVFNPPQYSGRKRMSAPALTAASASGIASSSADWKSGIGRVCRQAISSGRDMGLEFHIGLAQRNQRMPVGHLELDQKFPRDHVTILLVVGQVDRVGDADPAVVVAVEHRRR